MKVGLIDIDGKLPNLALMKISSFYKAQGATVELIQSGQAYDILYASAIFSKSRFACQQLQQQYGAKLNIGGTGWNIGRRLPPEIDQCKPDYYRSFERRKIETRPRN